MVLVSNIEKHLIPTAISVKPVLSLIKYHVEGDFHNAKESALKIAKELELNGEDDLSMYIYALYGLVATFDITD